MAACCTPQRPEVAALPAGGPVAPIAPGAVPTLDLVAIPACEFLMGNDGPDAVQGDGEGPARRFSLSAFSIAPATVTNREFGHFVRATRHVTEAERSGLSFVFFLQTSAEVRAASRQMATGMPWWLAVEHASWQRPEGPGSHIYERLEHPVVHVSWLDAQAYCAWAGVRLPTEAEWECAARGGAEGRRFPGGKEHRRDCEPRCPVWRGSFPNDPAGGGKACPVTAASGEPNGYGLFNTCGNVWEWCADWYHAGYHSATAACNPVYAIATGHRSMRGGSFLCHDSYCNRYRVAARHSSTPGSTASNIGFRVAR
jgi:formylglycine-generating enzyme required for sulfatase activity